MHGSDEHLVDIWRFYNLVDMRSEGNLSQIAYCVGPE